MSGKKRNWENNLSPQNAKRLKRLRTRKKLIFDNEPDIQEIEPAVQEEEIEDVVFENIGKLQTVFEDGNLKFQVQKRVPKSFNKFSAEDHSYRLIVVQKKEEESPPLLISLLSGLAKAIDNVLTMLKKNYNLNEHRMVYLSLVENSIVGAIHSGGFDLRTPNAIIVNTIMGFFKTALQSEKHLNLKLNDSFELHFMVISPRHVTDLAKRGKSIHVYGSKEDGVKEESFLIDFGSKFGPNCLIAACLASKVNNIVLKDDNEDPGIWTSILLPEDEQSEDFIKEKIQEVQSNLNLGEGPYDEEVLFKLASYFKSEICIFSFQEDLKIIFKSKPKFKAEDEILYLLSENSRGGRHLMSIINLKKFFNRHNRFACIFCEKIFHKSKGIHKCKYFKEFCFTCYRPIAKNAYFINEMNREFFCFPSVNEITCSICNRVPASKECKSFHKYHCKKAFFCPKCKRTILVSKGNLEETKTRHSCQKRCKVCSEESDNLKAHVCLMKMPKPQTNWSKIVIAYEFNCNIFEFQEENHHGEFALKINGEKISSLEEVYLPPILIKKRLNNLPLQTNFGQNCKRQNFENFFPEGKTEMEKFLYTLLCQEERQNSVVLFVSKRGLDFVIEHLLKLKIKPRISRNKKGVTLVNFKSQNVRFLDASLFFNVQYFEDPLLTINRNFENAVKFLVEIFKIQSEVKKDLPPKDSKYLPFLHPFSSPFTTRSSLMFNIFKKFYLSEKLYVIKKERHGINSPSSKLEIKFVCWLQKKYPKEEIVSSLSPYGQQYFRSSIPDAFLPSKNLAIYFHGCSIHSHDPSVCILRKGQIKNPFRISDLEVQKKDQQKMENLIKEIPGIKIEQYFECEMKQIWREECFRTKVRTSKRLCPKVANRGGRNEVFCNFCELTNEDEEILSLDIVSSYPFEAMRQNYPIGRYEILVGNEVEEIKFDGEQFLFKNVPILGLVQAEIIAPKHSKIPFLPFQVQEKVIYGLCFKCSKGKNQNFCTHSNTERKFTSTFTTVDINYAAKIGYSVKILEVYNYKDKAPFMRDFIKTLAFFKFKHSGFPKGLTALERSDYVRKVNEQMGFSDPFILSESNVQLNEFEREIYKESLNSFCGKWAQGTSKDYKEKTVFFDNGDDFLYQVFKEKNVTHIGQINDHLCEAVIKMDKSRISGNPEGNLIYNAMITAFGRIRLFEAMEKIESTGGKILYCDTDGVIFKCKKGKNPIHIGNLFGDFRNLHLGKEIQCFYSLGPKNFALVFKEKVKALTNSFDVVKVSGLSLAKEKINIELYKKMVKDSVSDIVNELKLPQMKQMKSNYNVKEMVSSFTLRNSIEKRRVHFINELSEHDSLPFGYSKNV